MASFSLPLRVIVPGCAFYFYFFAFGFFFFWLVSVDGGDATYSVTLGARGRGGWVVGWVALGDRVVMMVRR